MNIEESWRKACAVALTGLSGMGPIRLTALLADMPPEDAYVSLIEGRPLALPLQEACGYQVKALREAWQRELLRSDPVAELERCRDLGIDVWMHYGDYPTRLENDVYAPAVLFWQGRSEALTRPTVALIGTRHCSHEGRDIARRFGSELAEAGVSVVSGLALGIDAAAHRGALETPYGAPPIAVVGNGLDIVYPKRNSALFEEIRERGLLISEASLGVQPERWRFPARNRIIAGLADLVVVVESHERGGSLLTVNEAAERDVPVMAVPGSIHAPAARGTNALLRDGCAPACSIEDILMALNAEASSEYAEQELAPFEPVVDPSSEDQLVLECIDHSPTSVDDVLVRTGWSLGQVAAALHRLHSLGYITSEEGWWRRVYE